MGCSSSRLFKKEIQEELVFNNGCNYVNHVVSLTSTTYGALKLLGHRAPPHPGEEAMEVVNVWELMGGLEDGRESILSTPEKSPKQSIGFCERGEMDSGRRPMRLFMNRFGSPRKENEIRRLSEFNTRSAPDKCASRFTCATKGSPIWTGLGMSDSGSMCSRRKSFSPLLDQEILALHEKETSRAESLLHSFERKCPPGGENSVVVYTTTLRGIRKTFEDCNLVRSIIESHQVHLVERDVSMDSGFKEELKALMGGKEVGLPEVFVKGRLIGDADQVRKLEEEGRLCTLLEGISKQIIGRCTACDRVRFVMCTICHGSGRVLDDKQHGMVRCNNCNENGLVQCPFCC